MASDGLTYEEVLRSLEDIVAAEDRVNVFIASQSGLPVVGFGGRLRRSDGAFTYELRAMWGGDDLEVFYVDGGQDHNRLPCFVISAGRFEAACALTSEDLEDAPYWRGLSIFTGGVVVNIGVESGEEVD